MNIVNLYRKIFNPIIRYRVKKESIGKFKLRSAEEIFKKFNDFTTKYLAAEKKENKSDMTKYSNYIEVLKWVMNEST